MLHGTRWFFLLWLLGCLGWQVAGGQEPGVEAVPDADQIARLEKYLSGATLRGRYTVLGNDVPPAEEEYTIQSAKKLPDGDQWLLEARIKYGKFDVTVPLKLAIKWADKTPVITVEKLTIPGMGTFSARVLFHNEMYSGTWSHDEVRGHLFGRVIPAPTPPDGGGEQLEKDSAADSAGGGGR